MNEETILKFLSTPGAVVVLILWLNSRLAHVESCLECIATREGITLPKRRRSFRLIKSLPPILLVCGLAVLTGCAHVRQSVTNPDGSKTESVVLAVWPATSAIDKAAVRQTKTTQSIGIEGASAEGGGTNLVSALTELRGILTLIARP